MQEVRGGELEGVADSGERERKSFVSCGIEEAKELLKTTLLSLGPWPAPFLMLPPAYPLQDSA